MTTEHRRQFGPAGLSLPRSWSRKLAALGIVALGFGAAPMAAQAIVLGTSTTSVSSSSVSSVWGQSVALTATVTGSAVAHPSATVDFQADSVDIPGCAAVAVGGATNPTTAVCNTAGLTVTTHSITAIYAGDPNYTGSTSPALTQTVTQAASQGSGSVNVNPSVAGQPVTFTATEAAVGPGSGVPGGTVRFQAGGADILGCTATSVIFGLASCTTNALGTGTHSVRALYGGDVHFLGNNSPLVTQQVNQDGTTTAVFSSSNPSVLGQPLTLTARVTAAGLSTGVPTGTASFQDGGTPLGSCQLRTLDADIAQASCNLVAPAVATHNVTASYSGDANYTSSTGSISQAVNPGNTSTTVVSDHAPADPGQTVTFTATVTPMEPAAGDVSGGTVGFRDGETTIPGCAARPIVPGGTTATCATSGLGSGIHMIFAVYNNTDGNFIGSASFPLSQVIRFTTGTAVTSSTLSTIAGQTVTFTAAVTSGGPTPTGTVQFFFDDQPITCITGPTPSTLDGSAHAACDTAALPSGTHAITATYNSDGNNMTSTSPPITQFVNPGNTVTTLGTSVNPAVTGQSVTFSAHVSAVAPAMGTPSGTVQFTAAGSSIPGCDAVALEGSGNAACITSFMAGTDPVVAHYQGSGPSGSFELSDSPTVSEQVNRAATTVWQFGFAGPSFSGQPIREMLAIVSVVGPGAGTPGGLVTFQDGGATIEGCVVPVDGLLATCHGTLVAVGDHMITATLAGDANYLGSTSPPMFLRVFPDSTTTVVTSSASPSVTGQPVTYTATITADGSSIDIPAGQVNFQDGGVDIGGCTVPATSAGSGRATATCPVTYTTVGSGTHDITAAFTSSSENLLSSTSASFTQTVGKAATATSATTSTNPTVYGQAVTFTATVDVTGAGSGAPTGTVDFQADGADIASCGAQPLVLGSAACTTTALAQGDRNITALYSGDLNYSGSTSARGVQIIHEADATSTLTTGGSPSVYGQPVTFTDMVAATPPGTGVPTGFVAFQSNTVDIPGCGSVAVADGTSTCTTSAPLAIGTDAITARYLGDNNFVTGTSNSVAQTVNQSPTSTAVTSSGTPSVTGQPVTYTATVTPVGPGSGIPTGNVRFQNGGIDIGTCTSDALNGEGNTAICTVTHTGVGTQAITAIYGGDANFLGSTSVGFGQFVVQDTTHTVLTPFNPSVSGEQVTYTATVTADPPGGGTPLGTVNFQDAGGDIGCATQPLAGGIATCQATYANPGSHSITATYSGNVNYVASATGDPLTQTVNPALTTTSVSASPHPSQAGQTVTYTASVSIAGAGDGTPTGTLTFSDELSGLLPGCVVVPVTAPTCSITYGAAGSHTITVTYTGDGNFAASTSADLVQAVNRATTTAVVTSNLSPSHSGAAVTFTATVTSEDPASGIPSGSVDFKSDGSDIAGCTAASLNGSGVATCTTHSLIAGGSHTVTAGYGGDTTHLGTTSAALTQNVDSVNQGFVKQAYLDLLLRAADSGGLSYWTGRLDSGGLTRSEVALGIMSGSEYRAIEVQTIFTQYLDRSADPGAQVGYQAQIAHGASDQSIAAQLAASDDYYNSQGGGTNIGFVSVLYQDALGRTPDKGGLDYWTGRLAAGVSRGQVAASFINEFEGGSHAVSDWYPQFLGRAGDSGGVAYWATQIVHGRTYEQVIAAGFIGSAEYLGRVGL